MKLTVRLLSPLLVLVSTSSVLAVTHVWSAAIPTGGAASVIAPGSQGANTLLRCDVGAPFCTWAIAIDFQNDAGDLPSIAWSLDYASPYSLPEVSVDPGSLAYSPSPFTNHSPVPSYGVSPGPILTDANGADLSGAGSSGGNLAVFTLRKFNTAASPLTTIQISLGLGSLQWVDQQGNCTFMQYGGSPPVFCLSRVGTSAPITIEMVPEPTAIVLLAMTTLAVLRKRR